MADDNRKLTCLAVFTKVYPSKAGYARVQQQKSGRLELKQAQCAFTCHKQEMWNLYAPFATAAEWRTVALATK
jgi:hypothetical protein